MYIRTEDNLYEITDKQYDILCGNLTEEEKENYKNITSFGMGSVEEGTYKSILIKDIFKYSESLVELCDEFVLIERDAKPIIFKTLQGAINNKIYDDEIIYGCIWTNKGLIYVAKMNENGELELI